ncbi:MAG: hypothetical protein KIT79_13325 [Deltaproteobacteria bacterium]|nr:hypothetical protein [Deltaproteobacteria bacterium]
MLIPAVPSLLLNLFLFRDVYLGTRVFYYRDVLENYVPYRMLLASRIRNGELPLWVDHIYGGLPFWADPVNSILHAGQFPFYLFYGYLNPFWIYGLVAGLHFLFAQAGFYRLLRTMECRPGVAAAGSALIAYSPVALSLHYALQFLYGFSLLGWALASLIALRRSPSLSRAASLAGWTALLVFTGDIQLVYLLGLLTLASCAVAPGPKRKAVLAGGSAMAAGAILSAAVIVPGFEYSRNSSRHEQNLSGLSDAWSLHPVRFVEWLAPGLFDTSSAGVQADFSAIARSPANEGVVYFIRAHPSLLLLAALPWILVAARRDRRIAWLMGLAGTAIWLSLGSYGGLYSLLAQLLPGWGQFRFPERLLLHAFVAWGLAGALALEQLKPGADIRPGRTAFALWSGALLVLAVVGALSGGWATSLAKLTGVPGNPAFNLHVMGSFRLGALLLAVSLISLWMLRWAPKAGMWCLLAVLSAELLWLSPSSLPSAPAESVSHAPALLPALQEAFPDPSVEPPLLYINLPLGSLDTDPVRAETRYRWDTLRGNIVMLAPFSVVDGINSSWLADHERANRTISPGRRHRIENLRAVIVPVDRSVAAGEGEEWVCSAPFSRFPARACYLENTLPAARALRQWQTPGDPASLVAAVSAPEWNPELTGYIGRFTGSSPAPPPAVSGDTVGGEVTILAWRPELKVVSTRRPEPGPVVLRQNYYPGWVAYVNNVRQPVLAVNGYQLGAWVPAGESRVEFSFEPASVTAGLAISLAAWLALAVFALYRIRP